MKIWGLNLLPLTLGGFVTYLKSTICEGIDTVRLLGLVLKGNTVSAWIACLNPKPAMEEV